jgi:hypothetical protein
MVEARRWFDARESARALLGGQPEYVEQRRAAHAYIGILPPFEMWDPTYPRPFPPL